MRCFIAIILFTHMLYIVFNVGEYRRKAAGANKSHDFFRPDNMEAQKLRMYVEFMGILVVCNYYNNAGIVLRKLWMMSNTSLMKRKDKQL